MRIFLIPQLVILSAVIANAETEPLPKCIISPVKIIEWPWWNLDAHKTPLAGVVAIKAPAPPRLSADTSIELDFEIRATDVLVIFTNPGGYSYNSVSSNNPNQIKALHDIAATAAEWGRKAEAANLTDYSKDIKTFQSADGTPLLFTMRFNQMLNGMLDWDISITQVTKGPPTKSYASISRYEYPAFVAALDHFDEFVKEFRQARDRRLAEIAEEHNRKEKIFESPPTEETNRSQEKFSDLIVGKWQDIKLQTMCFSQDGSYSVEPAGIKGRWEIKGNRVVITFSDGRVSTMTLAYLRKDELGYERKGEVVPCPRVRD